MQRIREDGFSGLIELLDSSTRRLVVEI